jgi:hypothetical protein
LSDFISMTTPRPELICQQTLIHNAIKFVQQEAEQLTLYKSFIMCDRNNRNNTLFSHPQESAFKRMGWNTVTKTSSINFILDYQNSILISSIILLLRWVNK